MELSISEIARLTGITSRTLRHYDSIGLLAPSRIAASGYRHYDESALVRLQRILLLRDLGLSLTQIGEVLDRGQSQSEALRAHLDWLHDERERLGRQIEAVRSTITALEGGEKLMPESMFDGFDHTRYKDEVVTRWGAEAYEAGDRWWRSLDAAGREAFQEHVTTLNRDWQRAAQDGEDPSGARAQLLAVRHVEWLRSVPSAPSGDDFEGYLRGLGDMYVADPRFAANYGGEAGATFVRDALRAWLEADV